MYPLNQQPFLPVVNSSHSSFNSSAMGATSFGYALESTGVREWQLGGTRAVRLVGLNSVPYYVKFGSSTVAAASSNSVLCHGGTPEVFTVTPAAHSYVAVVSSTTITVNVTLGTGR